MKYENWWPNWCIASLGKDNYCGSIFLYDSILYVSFFRKGAAGAERREQEEHDAVCRSVSHQCFFLLHIHILKRYFSLVPNTVGEWGLGSLIPSYPSVFIIWQHWFIQRLWICHFSQKYIIPYVFILASTCWIPSNLYIVCLPCNKETLDACSSERDTDLG